METCPCRQRGCCLDGHTDAGAAKTQSVKKLVEEAQNHGDRIHACLVMLQERLKVFELTQLESIHPHREVLDETAAEDFACVNTRITAVQDRRSLEQERPAAEPGERAATAKAVMPPTQAEGNACHEQWRVEQGRPDGHGQDFPDQHRSVTDSISEHRQSLNPEVRKNTFCRCEASSSAATVGQR